MKASVTREGPTMLEPMLTLAEAAARLRISVRQVRRLIHGGGLPYISVTERRRVILESDVASYVAARRVIRPLSTGLVSAEMDKLARAFFAACTRADKPSRRIQGRGEPTRVLSAGSGSSPKGGR